ncbi:hypothetical protein QBC38DRAFT_509297 [Podospora fimiseda]|uniref:Uncharacterized protein n=1 Tax=Podospora fimiseda TaxID=252190 RepID=A0AAN7H388_9PEZI|nr:hypothetical protein QBC38DRAFT_509297 [Podospora fimiseda]
MPPTIFPSSNAPEQARLSSTYTRATSTQLLLSSLTTHDTSTPNYGRRVSPSSSSSSSPSRSRPLTNPPKTIQSSSFPNLSHTSTLYSSKNGLLHSILEAYNNHHNLILRPDDIWLAILTQLSFHLPKSPIPLLQTSSNIDDIPLHLPPQLSTLLPSFSTTTPNDLTVASIILLGTATKYLTHSQGTRCGIPSVTLLGTLNDWEEIQLRCSDYFGSGRLGKQVKEWYDYSLGYCLDGFITSFNNPRGEKSKRFWGSVVVDGGAGDKSNGSGKERYNGWITRGFCWWDEEGRSIGGGWEEGLSREEIPMGFVKVRLGIGREVMEMVGGSVGVRVRGDTVQPEAGWLVYRA